MYNLNVKELYYVSTKIIFSVNTIPEIEITVRFKPYPQLSILYRVHCLKTVTNI